jgi:hypothetical protein
MVRIENCKQASDDDYQIADLQRQPGHRPRSNLSERHGMKWPEPEPMCSSFFAWGRPTRGSGDGLMALEGNAMDFGATCLCTRKVR